VLIVYLAFIPTDGDEGTAVSSNRRFGLGVNMTNPILRKTDTRIKMTNLKRHQHHKKKRTERNYEHIH
jgi:hypothetical protein